MATGCRARRAERLAQVGHAEVGLLVADAEVGFLAAVGLGRAEGARALGLGWQLEELGTLTPRTLGEIGWQAVIDERHKANEQCPLAFIVILPILYILFRSDFQRFSAGI